jgi:DNA-binding phage protein
MSVNTISGASVTATSGGSFASARNNVMSAVAGQLGISQSDLQSQLKSGQSLADVAKAAGMSSEQLTDTITAALKKSNLPAGTDVSAMATRMTNHVGGKHHHRAAAAASSASDTSSSSTPATSSSSAVDTYL